MSDGREIVKILNHYLLIGRYEGFNMKNISEDGRIFIRAVRAIHIIGFVKIFLREIGFLS